MGAEKCYNDLILISEAFMSWFIFALLCMVGWGCADLFYELGTDENDRYSHLKIAVWVGLVMGVSAFALLPFSETVRDAGAGGLALAALKYSPASLCYIVSMVIGYAGLRYLETSIVSPVQNASGALSAICMLIWFSLRGSARDALSGLEIAGSAVIFVGVVTLAVVENRLKNRDTADDKYKYGALALIFPLLYCVFDTIGTAADGIILDESAGMGLGEIDVLVLYGLTFLLAGIGAFLFLRLKTGRFYNPFARSERPKCAAALCEEVGQVFYVYAMALNPVPAAPMVASYCVLSLLLTRLFAGEKLKKKQYACIFLVIVGIVLLGISDGLSA